MKKKFLAIGLSLGLAVVGLSSVYLNSGLKGLNSTVAEDQTYTLTLNSSTWTGNYDGEKLVQDYPLTAYTSNGNPISIVSGNNLLHYGQQSGGWGGFYNGVQADAEFHSTTAITGIKKIELTVFWNNFAYDSTEENIINVTTSDDSAFSTNVSKQIVGEHGVVQERGVKSYSIDCPYGPSFFKIDFGTSTTGKNRHAYTVITSLKITYSCANPDNKLVHNVNRNENVFVATSLDDGNGWSNFKASYAFFGVYSDTAIVSADIAFIDHDYRAYSGLVVTDGTKLDATQGYETPRNFKSFQLGLAKKGFFSCCDLSGNRGRDASNAAYYPETAVGTSGKMTIVLKNNVLNLYINDTYINSKNITAVDPVGGFAANAPLMFGVWFHNYQSISRTITLIDEIYGAEAVAAEIASNDTYANLRG